jgi:hypothetical protein
MIKLFISVFSAEIQDNLSLLDGPYSVFYVEFGMSSEFDFADFIPRDDMSLWCDRSSRDNQLLWTDLRIDVQNGAA